MLIINKAMYDNLSDSEKIVVEYINNHEEDIPNVSITTIADKTFTSVATVSRAIQKCGYRGISELRYEILNKNTGGKKKETYALNSIMAKLYRECTDTIDGVSIPSILKINEHIRKARKIYIFARGLTASIVEEFHMQLELLGFNVTLVSDAVWLRHAEMLVKEDDLVIIFTVKNTTPELALGARVAKDIGAKVVVCSCTEGTTLEKYADITVIGHSESNIGDARKIEVSSRIPLLIIAHMIVEYLNL